jgi:phosphoglycolate phosphatase-like HAD superfamily hydrolase
MKQTWCKADLIELKKRHDVLVAVDSDGCVFDSMTVKQRIFHSGIIRFWGLEAIDAEFRRVAEWTALYSPWRGLNRFELLLQIFRHLAEKVPDFQNQPDTRSLEAFVNSGVALSADELAKQVGRSGDPELKRVLEWSRAVSREIAEIPEMPLFAEVVPGLERIRSAADVIVVSQTAEEALVREWHQAGIGAFADVIAGAELGSKTESLRAAMQGRYAPEYTLMVGDAPGDLEAARAAGCLFFPILPGRETESWVELRENGLSRVIQGTFAGAFQDGLISTFLTVLSA